MGNDTFFAGSGSETIGAMGIGSAHATDVVYGNSSMLLLFADGGATVFGGSGSDTVFGGTGPDLLEGGSAGNNFLQAGSGPATLFAGGSNDQLYAVAHRKSCTPPVATRLCLAVSRLARTSLMPVARPTRSPAAPARPRPSWAPEMRPLLRS